jgi:hypothetical protein
MKILFLEANPKGTATLSHGTELEAIRMEIAKSGGSDHLQVVDAPHVTPDTLQECLLKEKPHVVHFSGHGALQRYLLLPAEGGLAAPVSGDALATVFRTLMRTSWRVRCVVLNACYSDGVAEDLAKCVPCVVGMTDAIRDVSAIAFAAGFYLALATGSYTQLAVEAGRNQIRLTPGAWPGDWDLPRVRATLVDAWKYDITADWQPETSAPGGLLHGKYALAESHHNGPIARTDFMEDVQLRRTVVVKTLTEPAARASFLDEVRDLVRMSKHPNIVAIYGSWLHDEPPHYVREYVEGRSLRDWLDNHGPAGLSINFVHQVLASLGEAMAFATRAEVWDLGVKPERVLIQERRPWRRRGLPSEYRVVICPGPGGSNYIQSWGTGGFEEFGQLYDPPEYAQRKSDAIDPEKVNQYRLGILGYELLIGSIAFRKEARRQATEGSDSWTPVKDLDTTRHCPNFLGEAIERMIKPEPGGRFDSFDEAVEAIAHRNLHVEVARDSFARILDKDKRQEQMEEKFFHKFYTTLLGRPRDPGTRSVRDVFARLGPLQNPPGDMWERQFDALKEAIVFLFAYNLLREAEDSKRTILSRIAEQHSRFKEMHGDYYEDFGQALLATVRDYDDGGIDRGYLQTAWREAIAPGLKYLKKHGRP